MQNYFKSLVSRYDFTLKLSNCRIATMFYSFILKLALYLPLIALVTIALDESILVYNATSLSSNLWIYISDFISSSAWSSNSR